MARVLLVEDEITVLILAESVVQGLGHSTYSAGSVVQGLALLDDPGEIDFLFTDIRLARRRFGRPRARRAGTGEKPRSQGALHHGGHHHRRHGGDVRRWRRDALSV